MPPAVGRTTVWMMSLTLSTAGILSATISSTSRMPITSITHSLLSHAHAGGSCTQSRNRAESPTASSGM
jgi:hypothetical protein